MAKQPNWTSLEDGVLLENPDAELLRLADLLPGRSLEAIKGRRRMLGLKITHHRTLSPFCPSTRPLLAKTCSACGLLLPGSWFGLLRLKGRKDVRKAQCKKCMVASLPPRKRPKPKHEHAWEKTMQAVTLPVAIRSGMPLTEKDYKTLQDDSMTNMEKAVKLRRTYFSVRNAVTRGGYKSKNPRALSDPRTERWLIDNPNLPEVMAITDWIMANVTEQQRRQWGWDWNDDDLELAS